METVASVFIANKSGLCLWSSSFLFKFKTSEAPSDRQRGNLYLISGFAPIPKFVERRSSNFAAWCFLLKY